MSAWRQGLAGVGKQAARVRGWHLVKIDGSFITGLSDSEPKRAVVRGLVQMFRRLGILTAAECGAGRGHRRPAARPRRRLRAGLPHRRAQTPGHRATGVRRPSSWSCSRRSPRCGSGGDDLFGIGAVQRLVVEFIEQLHDIDPVGDAGRYGHDRRGNPALRSMCCADPNELRAAVVRLYDYVTSRLDAAAL